MNHSPQEDTELFLSLLPKVIRDPLMQYDLSQLVEVVLDVSRPPEARFFDGAVDLLDKPVTQEFLNMITAHLAFGEDNRAGISGTLHRISAIKDRRGEVVGLTCRVGRAIYGTAEIIEDLLASGKSILVLGRPGLGKTTRLRDAARLLSTKHRKRVIIVDTSNEIAGDGTAPHPAIGRSRRMQVPSPARQASIMIEAVENHTPEVIVIDEIGDSKDVAAARTIAERGVQLIATAHGHTLGSIVDNPMLSDLLGGCQSVVLGDEEAKRRGTKKTVTERKHNPTFDVVIEIVDFDTLAVYPDAGKAVDAYLAGRPPLPVETRGFKDGKPYAASLTPAEESDLKAAALEDIERYDEAWQEFAEGPTEPPLLVYTLGLSRNNVRHALEDLGIKATIVNKPEKSNLILVVGKREVSIHKFAKQVPVVIVKSNTRANVEAALTKAFSSE